MISTHLPALQVAVPLVSAPVCTLLRDDRAAWAFTLLVNWIALGIAIALLRHVSGAGSISYALGSWAAPWGIEYRVDALSAIMLLIVSAIGAVMMPFACNSVRHEIPRERISLFYTCYLLSLTGLLGIVITGDAFNLFVFLEISSLSSYVLISLGADRRALTAAYQYLIMGSIGATFILIGIGLLYMMTGTLNMADLSMRLAGAATSRTGLAAFAFVTVGVSLKLALFPLHLWLPNAYTWAPSAVSAFIAATATKVGVYVLLRFFFTVFGTGFTFEAINVGPVLIALATIGMTVASIIAFFQDNVKRMLAYSSVAQIGYIVLGVSLASLTGIMAGIIQLFSHALVKGGLFLAIGCIYLRLGSVNLRAMKGVAQRMPFTMAAFVAGGLSLVGVPLTTGFLGKWYLVQATLEQGWWVVTALILLSSLIALAYVWRVIESAYFHSPDRDGLTAREAPATMLVPTWLLIGANIYFGVDADFVTGLAREAARILLGAGP